MAHNISTTHINKIPGLIKFLNNEQKLTSQRLGTGIMSQVDSKQFGIFICWKNDMSMNLYNSPEN